MIEPLTVPEWVCTLVGRLVLDNEALRREVTRWPSGHSAGGAVTEQPEKAADE